MKMEIITLSEICESIYRSFSKFEDIKEVMRNHISILMGRDMLSELEHLVVNLKSYVKDENRKHVSHSINIMSLSNPSFDAHIPLEF
jgi:hypothetical protein